MELAVKAYSIDVHPNKEAVFEWVRNNWHDLADTDLDDIVASLKALAAHIKGHLNYSVSCVPDRGEFVRLTDFNSDLLKELDADSYPLTGTWSDYCVIQSAQNDNLQSVVLKVCHDSGEFRYSDEGLEEFLFMNEYLFLEDGRVL
jgi:hypothetical protein